jgi:hypothetical protein
MAGQPNTKNADGATAVREADAIPMTVGRGAYLLMLIELLPQRIQQLAGSQLLHSSYELPPTSVRRFARLLSTA